MADYLFFDLDGTVTDPYLGITNCIYYALDRMGRPKPERSFLRRFIGPPLTLSFRAYLGMTEEEADTALRYYRERYAVDGLFENAVYPGIPEALASLKNAGKAVCLATSKPEPFAARILAHFSLEGYFAEICGASLDGTRNEGRSSQGTAPPAGSARGDSGRSDDRRPDPRRGRRKGGRPRNGRRPVGLRIPGRTEGGRMRLSGCFCGRSCLRSVPHLNPNR